ncbi:hypothetical protein JCM11641_008339 [Rhodosporidiobolus odoratus]
MADEHVILGSGIIGLCTAYYTLSLSTSARVILIESSPSRAIAGGASSNAGGFIACGAEPPAPWHEPPSAPLAKLSWDCHVELARKLGGENKWGWRECGAIGLNVGGEGEERSKYRNLPGGKGKNKVGGEEGGELPDGTWVEGEREDLSTEGGVAQVDPAQFCSTIYLHLCATYPTRFRTLFGRSTSISPLSYAGRQRILNLRLHPDPSSSSSVATKPSSLSIPFDTLTIAAGPWSAAVCAELNLPLISLTNLPGHSLLIRPALQLYTDSTSPTSTQPHRTKQLPPEAVFAGISGAVSGVHASTSGLARGLTQEETAEGYTRSPELFVRANGLIYVAGENSIPEAGGATAQRQRRDGGGLPNMLPKTVDEVKGMVDQRLVGRLKRAAGAVSPLLKEENGAVVEREQFCYRPIAADREPIMGELSPGVFIATGHGPWGITLAPGTGKTMAELLLGKPPSADISLLHPSRFRRQAKL